LRHATAKQFFIVTKLGDESRLVLGPEKDPVQHLDEHGLLRGGRALSGSVHRPSMRHGAGKSSPYEKKNRVSLFAGFWLMSGWKTITTLKPMKTNPAPHAYTGRTQAKHLTLAVLCATVAGNLLAQTPCPSVETFATGLLAPSKIIQTPRGNFIVAEGGPQVPNNGRVSIVDQHGHRRTLLDGLPSARTFVGDFNGTTGVWLEGRTLFILNGQGDVTLAGPVPGTEQANPTPASPLFSSVLAVTFSAAMEETTTGVTLTLADHQSLKAGRMLVRSDSKGRRMLIQLIADFPDYAPEPRPNFAGNVRHSHPYGVVGWGRFLYIVDAGFNSVRKVSIFSGEVETLAGFAPTPNPRLPAGPPVLENVPTSIRWDGGELAVTLLSGGPFFIPGFSQVQQVDPRTGEITSTISGLSSAIDVIPLPGCDEGHLTLEHNLTFPLPGPGRLQYFSAPDAAPVVLADCLTTPTSMVLDRRGDRLVIAELTTGRLVTLELP